MVNMPTGARASMLACGRAGLLRAKRADLGTVAGVARSVSDQEQGGDAH
jgi:hypothetical protein